MVKNRFNNCMAKNRFNKFNENLSYIIYAQQKFINC